MADLWACPDCGREFASPRQWHSCGVSTVAEHLTRAAPTVREGVEAVLAVVAAIDGARVDPVRTGITLMTDRAFGYVTVRRGHADLQLRLEGERRPEKAHRVERVGARSWAHQFRIEGVADVDEELTSLILEAAG